MLAPAVRRAVLTAHIIASVGLLGEVSGFLAIALEAAPSEDPAFAASSYDLLATLSAAFGIPLSITALATGVVLGRGTKWGVFRTPWVAIKLGLLATVILVGALIIGPSVDQMRTGGGGAETRIVLGAAWDVLALALATGLSVYKPGRTHRAGLGTRSFSRRTAAERFAGAVRNASRIGLERTATTAKRR